MHLYAFIQQLKGVGAKLLWENAVVIQNWVIKSAKKQEKEVSLTIKKRDAKK